MLNLFYDSEEVYSYVNYDELLKTLDFDSFGQIALDIINKSITYKINRRNCIRLSDLIFWIEQDFVRIHLGQLLQLIFKLLEKVQFIESQGIEHYYLDLNRIWLLLSQNSQYPNLIYQYLYYSIHFTGYQCPIYENSNLSQSTIKASLKINQIIQFIINHCYKEIRTKWKNPDKRNTIFQDILEPIINLCQSNCNSQKIMTFIQETLIKYNYQDDYKNQLVQLLNIDDFYDDYVGSERHIIIPKVNKDLTEIIQFGSQYGQVVIEYLLQYYIPIISKHLQSYSKIKLDYIIKAQEQYNILQQGKSKLENQIKVSVQFQIKYALQQYEKQYKFEFTQQEMNQLEKEIVDSVIQSQNVKQFYNTYWLHINNEDIYNNILVAISKILFEFVQEKIDILFMYKILLLIDELI